MNLARNQCESERTCAAKIRRRKVMERERKNYAQPLTLYMCLSGQCPKVDAATANHGKRVATASIF